MPVLLVACMLHISSVAALQACMGDIFMMSMPPPAATVCFCSQSVKRLTFRP